MPRPNGRFALQSVLDLKDQVAMKALQQLNNEEHALRILNERLDTSRLHVEELFASFHNDEQVDYTYAMHFPFYIQKQRDFEAQLQQQIRVQENHVAQARRMFKIAKIESKSLEKLKEKQAKVFKHIIAHKEATEMDELGLQQFSRRSR